MIKLNCQQKYSLYKPDDKNAGFALTSHSVGKVVTSGRMSVRCAVKHSTTMQCSGVVHYNAKPLQCLINQCPFTITGIQCHNTVTFSKLVHFAAPCQVICGPCSEYDMLGNSKYVNLTVVKSHRLWWEVPNISL